MWRRFRPGSPLPGRTENAISVIENPTARIYAVEFHPEVRHTEHGAEILKRFVQDVGGIQPNWFPRSFIEETVERVRREVDGGRALCALSGGVDSAVAATLVGRAIGDRLTCLFVDNGLLRKNEFEQVAAILREQAHLNVRTVDASSRFLTRLGGVTDPEQKRKIIGEEFIRVFEAEARRPGGYTVPRAGDALPGRDRIGFRQRVPPPPSRATTTWEDCRRT